MHHIKVTTQSTRQQTKKKKKNEKKRKRGKANSKQIWLRNEKQIEVKKLK